MSGFIEWLGITCALAIMVTTAHGAPAKPWEVYCWMVTIIMWIVTARQRRFGKWL